MGFIPSAKNLIIHAIMSRLEGYDVNRLLLKFDIIQEKYSVFMSIKDEKQKIDLTENDANTIKKIFIEKIKRAFSAENDTEIKNIIIDIDVKNQDLNIFMEPVNGELIKYNYLKTKDK